MEKFQFNVGDYVETKDGKIGYVCSFAYRNEYYQIDAKYRGYKKRYFGKLNVLYSTFNRIGKYDFTKPQKQNKIEPLPNMDFVCYDNKLADCKMNQQNVLEIYDKLNEIINYINSQEN